MALRSSQTVALHREHIRLMQEVEEQALREESKSHHEFLSACQDALHHAPQPLKENLATSYHFHHLHLLHPPGHPQWKNSHLQILLPCQHPNSPHSQKGGILHQSHRGACLQMKLPQGPCRKDHLVPRDEKLLPGSLHSNLVVWRPSSRTPVL